MVVVVCVSVESVSGGETRPRLLREEHKKMFDDIGRKGQNKDMARKENENKKKER